MPATVSSGGRAAPTRPRPPLLLGVIRLLLPTRHPRLQAWRRWWSHVGAALLLAVILGGVILPRLHGAAELTIYRLRMQELGEAVRAMQMRARAQHHPTVLIADPARRAFQVSGVYERPTTFERIEEMIWLPKGLEITEATPIRAEPSGRLGTGTILVTAPAFNRIFRIEVQPDGRVIVREETVL